MLPLNNYRPFPVDASAFVLFIGDLIGVYGNSTLIIVVSCNNCGLGFSFFILEDVNKLVYISIHML